MAVLQLGYSRTELHGSLGEYSGRAESELYSCQPQEELLSESSRQRQICLLPNRQRVQEAHHVLVQVRKSEHKNVDIVSITSVVS